MQAVDRRFVEASFLFNFFLRPVQHLLRPSLNPTMLLCMQLDWQHDLLSILYFVTYTCVRDVLVEDFCILLLPRRDFPWIFRGRYTTIGYGDQPTMPPLVRNYTSWTAVVNLAVYAYFFVFVAKSLEKVRYGLCMPRKQWRSMAQQFI